VSQRVRNRRKRSQSWERLGLYSGPVVRYLSSFLVVASLTGCVDGPLFALKRANPYFRAQWKEDAEKGIVFSQRQEEIRKVRDQIPSMADEEQRRWVAQLANVYDYETSPELKRDAVMALGATLHPDAEAPLIRACSDKNDKVRLAACKALAGRQTESASGMLATVAQMDKNMSVRSAAIRSLGTYQNAEAKSLLRKTLDEKSPLLQYEATVALKTMTGQDFGGDVPSWRQFMDGQPVEEPDKSIAERISSSLLRK
jgi:HEAT repeat protein